MTRDDFRIRRIPHKGCYRVWQRIGSGWEALADLHSTRADAAAWITAALRQHQQNSPNHLTQRNRT